MGSVVMGSVVMGSVVIGSVAGAGAAVAAGATVVAVSSSEPHAAAVNDRAASTSAPRSVRVVFMMGLLVRVWGVGCGVGSR